MVQYLNDHGSPVGAAINGGEAEFQAYASGIYSCKNLGAKRYKKKILGDNLLTHAVTITGYGTAYNTTTGESQDYWVVKNSWSENWGDNGYFWLPRGKDAMNEAGQPNGRDCGVLEDISALIGAAFGSAPIDRNATDIAAFRTGLSSGGSDNQGDDGGDDGGDSGDSGRKKKKNRNNKKNKNNGKDGDINDGSSSQSSSSSYPNNYLQQENDLQSKEIDELREENAELIARMGGQQRPQQQRQRQQQQPQRQRQQNVLGAEQQSQDGNDSSSYSNSPTPPPGTGKKLIAGAPCDMKQDECSTGMACVDVGGDIAQCKMQDIAKLLNP